MEPGKSIRRAFSINYQRHQAQLRKDDKAVPEGMPSLTASGKETVGPNRFASMTAEQQKNASPNYPLEYHIPSVTVERGIFKKTPRIEPTGEKAYCVTGPGLLPPEHRVPGRFDYSTIPDVMVTPLDKVTLKPVLHEGTDHIRAARKGIPADPVTGLPKIPTLRNGPYKVEASYPDTEPQPGTGAAADTRRVSLDSLGYPKID